MNIKKFFGPASFEKHAIRIAVPIMVQQLITSCVNLLDNVMVGQLGDAALSGVAAGNRYYMIANFGMLGLTGSAMVFLAQYYGAKDDEHMKQTFRYMILSCLLIAIPLCIFGVGNADTIIQFFTDEADTVIFGTHYLRVAAFSFLPLAISLSIACSFRALGETKIPLYIGIVTIFTNAIANYMFIFGPFGLPAYGIVGAAYGTIVARLVEVVMYMFALKCSMMPFKTSIFSVFHIERMLVRNITWKALPLVINELAWSAGMAMQFKLYATRGDVAMAGCSVASTTSDIFFTLFSGMATATTVVVSHKLGANQLEEARQNGYFMIGLSFKLAIVVGCLMFGSSFVVPHFYDISIEAKQLARHLLYVGSALFWIYMANTQCYFILRAGGETKKTLLMDSLFMWICNIPIVACVAYCTPVSILILYVVSQLTDVVKLFVSFGMLHKETWVTNLTIVD